MPDIHYEKQMGIFYRAWNALECVVGDGSLLGHILFSNNYYST